MNANIGTHLEADGTAPVGYLHATRDNGTYEIKVPYKCNGRLVAHKPDSLLAMG